MSIETESNEERELFERMKAKCSICGSTDCTHQVQFMSISMDEYIKLSDELALARVLIRELGDRLAKLEKPWVGLTIEDVKVIEDNAPSKQMAIFMAEATLKEKNT